MLEPYPIAYVSEPGMWLETDSEIEGLNPAAEEARRKLAEHLETLDAAAKRAAERRNQERVGAGV